jgi:hypothetical protein
MGTIKVLASHYHKTVLKCCFARKSAGAGAADENVCKAKDQKVSPRNLLAID